MTGKASAATAGPGALSEDALDAYEQRAFGFWLYLMSDALIFALLFATYAVMTGDRAGGLPASALFSLPNTLAETLLLLFSSITFGFSSLALRSGKRAGVLAWLLVSAGLGAAFVGLEISEFIRMIEAGAGPDRSGALSAFFTLVGTHGVHVSVGLVWILVMVSQIVVKGLSPPVASRMFRLGLFWHFLDIIWIGIFSIVYLPGIL